MHELLDQLLSQLKGAWRYRWYAVIVAWIIAIGGWIAVYLMPDRYEASARVFVDTGTVLRPLLLGLTVQPNLEQTTAMMSRTLISRPNLEKVIQMAGLEGNLKSTEDRVQLIGRLMTEVSIKSAGKENLYTISFTNQDPQVAKRVVQSLLSLFMKATVDDSRADSEAAQRFIDEQVKDYSDQLLVAETAISQFKRQHIGLMPGEGRDYYARLADAKMAQDGAALELKEAENSRDVIRNQLERGAKASPVPVDGRKAADRVGSPIDARIQTLEQKVDTLRLTYTEQHPDIVSSLRAIAQLKEQKEAEAKLQNEAEAKLGNASPSAAQAKDPVYQQLTVALTTAESNVARVRARIAEFGRRYTNLQASANAAPQVEAQYTQLTRDYAVIKARYDELLRRRESAKISGQMESSDLATSFRVIDPPHVPSKPNSPDRLRLMTIILFGALGGGFGVAYLISQLRPAVNDERRLKEVSGLPVLGTLAMTWTAAQKARRVWGMVVFLISFVSLLSAYVAIMATLVLTVSRA